MNKEILDKIATIWKANPSWRFGQLIENVCRGSEYYTHDKFYMKDEDFEELLNAELIKINE